MRILLVPQGTQGDVRPLAALGTELREAGHQVLFGVSPDHQHWLEELGFEVHRVGPFMQAASDETDRSVGRPLRILWHGIKFMMGLVPSQFADLEALVDRADLVLGSGLELAGRTLAKRRRIPYRFVCQVPTAIRSAFHPPVAIPFRPFPKWMNRLLWWSNTVGTALTFGRQIQAERRRLGMAPVSDLSQFLGSGIVMAADPELAPLPLRLPDSASYWPLGPARRAATPRASRCISFERRGADLLRLWKHGRLGSEADNSFARGVVTEQTVRRVQSPRPQTSPRGPSQCALDRRRLAPTAVSTGRRRGPPRRRGYDTHCCAVRSAASHSTPPGRSVLLGPPRREPRHWTRSGASWRTLGIVPWGGTR